MDGLHLQATRRFQRAGEQLTGAHPKFWAGVRYSSIADRGIQRIVIEGDPVAEGRKHPLRHVGGGSLGEGDAENFLRRHAAEQKSDHPLHQHMRLARTGVGRDERGRRGIRCACLRGAHGLRDGTRRRYHSSIPSPPAADHSLMRARSSYVP